MSDTNLCILFFIVLSFYSRYSVLYYLSTNSEMHCVGPERAEQNEQ